MTDPQDNWAGNYFNYFTEVEEHFQRVRGTSLFPALAARLGAWPESWKNGGVPLAAVLRGIDAAFEKWRGRKSKTQMVNSLAFCAQAVLTEAQIMAGAGQAEPRQPAAPPFPVDDLRNYLQANAQAVRGAGFAEIAASLENLAAETELHYRDLEQLEQRLTALEEKLIATLKSAQSEEALFLARRDLDAHFGPTAAR